MPIIELPNGVSAVILSRNELTERASRKVSDAWVRATSIAARLAIAGWDEDDPQTWGPALRTVPQEEFEDMRKFQTTLVLSMIKTWTLGDINEDALLDLPHETYEALAAACSTEYNRADDFSPDGVADPKAATPDSIV